MLLYKNMLLQILKNRVFVILLWILTMLTSLSYFFVQFSIDGNRDIICQKAILSENELMWERALDSNTSLANIFLLATTMLTCFVFFMFYYRFIRANKVQIGCAKSLGMKDREIFFCFLSFSAILTVIGEIAGAMIGYLLSDVLVQAYVQSYGVTEPVKGIHISSVLLGLGAPLLAYGVITFVCFLMVKGKEAGTLLAGRALYKKQGMVFHMADSMAKLIPAKEKFPFRIALRKPVAIILMFFAILFFQVCVILGQSLNLSSQKVMQSQMEGHDYQYDTRMDEVTGITVMDGMVPYLYQECEVILDDKQESVAQTMIGLYEESNLLTLENKEKEKKDIPSAGTVYINAGLADMYRVNIGDSLTVCVNGIQTDFQVTDILWNAKAASIYCNAEDLAIFMNCTTGSYNGVWSMESPDIKGVTESKEQRTQRLERDAVSNGLSAVICQLTGAVMGMILLFLALFLNFQDNQRDMDILRMIGYQGHEIRKLFVDVYWPIVVVFFVLGIVPGLIIAQSIQRGLSLSIQDYMPFGSNLRIFVLMFFVMNMIYGCVWIIFTRKLHH